MEWISEDCGCWPVSQTSEKPFQGENTDLNDSDDPLPSIGRGGILARCAQVNGLWFYEAARVLWRDWDDWPICGQSVSFKTFEKMGPARRQIYANMVDSAELVAIEDEDLLEKIQTTLEDIKFPNLKTIELLVPGDCNYETNSVQIPIFHAPRLTRLCIDPHYEWISPLYFVSRDEWKILFQIAHSRNIEEIMIVDGPRIWEDERMKLKIELPHLKVLYMSACVDKTNSDSEI